MNQQRRAFGPPSFPFGREVTAGQADFYEEYGFLVYRGVFSEEEVRTIREDARDLERRTLNGEIPPERRDQLLPPGKDKNGRLYLHRLLYFTRYCERTRRLIEERGLDAIGPGLLGEGAWRLDDTMGGAIWQMKTGGKGSYSSIDWHLDFPEDHPLVPVVSAGIYLDPSQINNGCLMVVPTSHRYPPSRVPPTPLAVEAAPGDVICHAYNIFHESGPISEGQQRATLYLYFCAADYPGAWLPFAGEEGKKKIQTLFHSDVAAEEVHSG
jgi:phytanoyl-CoA hydroxylase